MNLRETAPGDLTNLLTLHRLAFGESEGAAIEQLVGELFSDPTAEPLLSIVAEADNGIVGHVLFTQVSVAGQPINGKILAPLAVHPDCQRKGIGRALIEDGLQRLKRRGCALVFVFGDPNYYQRFGFSSATKLGLAPPHPIPEVYADAWMVTVLSETKPMNIAGTVCCSKVLNAPEHWQV